MLVSAYTRGHTAEGLGDRDGAERETLPATELLPAGNAMLNELHPFMLQNYHCNRTCNTL
jgi:hypothetical protein